MRKKLKLPTHFVIHSLRHTALTRLGESGAGDFEIVRVAGHSNVTVSQKYVHPLPEYIEWFEAMNTKARAGLPGVSQNRALLPTVFTKVGGTG